MADKISPLGVLDPLDVLEDMAVQWVDFCQKTAMLADRFALVATEADLETAVDELVALCQEYPCLALLLMQAGSKRPPALTKEPTFSPKEIANQYQDLFARLGADARPEGRGDDSSRSAKPGRPWEPLYDQAYKKLGQGEEERSVAG